MPTDRDRLLTLKAEFKDLVTLCGGQDRCATLLGVSQARMSEATSVHHLERSPRLDHVAHLEADVGVPVVTRILADLHSSDVVPRRAKTRQDAHLHLAHIIRETGEVAGAISQALADGRINRSEAIGLKREAQDAIAVLSSFILEMTAIAEGEG